MSHNFKISLYQLSKTHAFFSLLDLTKSESECILNNIE
jgi:hypothetical protein